jgi:pyruvate formate lyase activating enzyme
MSTCWICPNNCEIDEDSRGRCGVRLSNKKSSALISCLCVDPIEKRPFFYFLPGNKFLSCGFIGCNLGCKFCVNSEVSRNFSNIKTTKISPPELVATAVSKRVAGIVFSYSEPIIHYEYLKEVAENVYETGLKLAIKTNGYFNPVVIKDLSKLYDAFNVDIKGDESVYKLCGGSLDIVRKNIEILIDNGNVVEISYLATPLLIDNHQFHKSVAKWLSSLNSKIPVHLLKYVPDEYSSQKLVEVKNTMNEFLDNIFIHNVYDSVPGSISDMDLTGTSPLPTA